jgi:hypothetical protein
MSSIIVYESREVKAKGLNKFDKINKDKFQDYFLEGDYERLSQLDNIKLGHHKEKLSLLYPGSGADIFFPLVYLQKLFPQVKKAKLTFIDSDDNMGIIKTMLDDVGISFKGNNHKIKFYWQNKLIKLEFFPASIESYFKRKKKFEVYFEKAFRLMRDQIPKYEETILSLLNEEGVLISDTGFLKKELKYIDVPKDLSSYGEMVLGIKKENKK